MSEEATDLEEPFRLPHRWIVALLLAVFLIAGALSARNDSAVFDETAHLPAGFTYLDRGDFRLNPEHPPLAKLWAALPLWLSGEIVADYASPAWNGESLAPGSTMRTGADQWVFGYEFLNGPRDAPERHDPARFLVPARLAMLLWGALLGLIVFGWAREMWGTAGGLVGLYLYCLSPTMLAHSRLVTTDLPISLAFTATLWCFWRFTRQPDWLRGAWVGVTLAAAMLIKFSSLLLGGLLVLLGALWCLWPGLYDRERPARRRLVVYVLLGALTISVVGIWAGYGFRYLASPDPTYQLEWKIVGLDREGLPWKALARALDAKVLPQSYLYGLAYFLGGAERRLAYLNGEQSFVGWWYYFPEAFLLKTPPAFLLLLAVVVGGGLLRTRGRSFDGWYLALPVLVYFGVSMAGNLNIGHRHLSVVYPLLFVGAGGAVELIRGRWRTPVLAVLLAGHAASFVAATPGYLSYFNFFAGGAEGGRRYLLDSNLDWGQDLARLKNVLEREGIGRVHLAYFGTADPRAYGIDYVKVYMVHDFYPERPATLPRSGDVLAISVNFLQGLYTRQADELAASLVRRGWVEPGRIREWQELVERRTRHGARHPELGDWLIEQRLIDPVRLARAEAETSAAWLARLRDDRQPITRAGDSILLYRVP